MASTTILFYFLAFSVFVLAYWYYNYVVKLKRRLYKIKGPTAFPLIGNALDVLPLSEIVEIMIRMRKRCGSMIKGILAFDIFVLSSNPKFAEFVCTSKDLLTKSIEYKLMQNWLGEGLLTSTGTKWYKRRRLLTPSFHFNILEDFIEVFNSCGDILIKKLKSETKMPRTDLYPYITLCTLDVIYESTMGVKVDAQTNQNSEYVQAVKTVSKIIFNRIVHLLKRFNFFFYLSRDYHIEKRAIKILHDTTDKVIRTRRELLLSKNNNKTDEIFDEIGVKRRKAFLDILLESTIDGKPLTDEEIREEVDTFLFEGHDTTSSAITFALYEISKHPIIQERIVEEMKSIYGKDLKRPTTSQDLQNMRYLEMVIKETLRKYPSVPVLARKNETDIPYDGMTLSKGSTIAILTYTLHRETDTFPDPEKFDPERFTPENKSKIGPYAYIPFSAGYRNCIGQRFAMLELKSIISKIVRNFELLPVKDFQPKLVAELILRSDNGILVQLKDRT